MLEVPSSPLRFRTSAPLGFSGVPVCQSEAPNGDTDEHFAEFPDSLLGFSPGPPL